MDAVKDVDTKERSQEKTLRVQRVDDLSSFQQLMPFIAHNEDIQRFAIKRFRDPDTLILRYGKSCFIVYVLDDDFLGGRVAIFVWAQNPDHMPTKEVMSIVDEWSRDRGAERLVAFVGEDGPMMRLKALRRLTGMKPHKIAIAKEL